MKRCNKVISCSDDFKDGHGVMSQKWFVAYKIVSTHPVDIFFAPTLNLILILRTYV